ncbi:MAG TPA: hypothetical protein VGF76_02805, partial [Polyangiaceae bacterium]
MSFVDFALWALTIGLLVAMGLAFLAASRARALGRALTSERAEHAQKERLLQTIVENAPMAIVL